MTETAPEPALIPPSAPSLKTADALKESSNETCDANAAGLYLAGLLAGGPLPSSCSFRAAAAPGALKMDVGGNAAEAGGCEGKVHPGNQLRPERFTALILPVETVYP